MSFAIKSWIHFDPVAGANCTKKLPLVCGKTSSAAQARGKISHLFCPTKKKIIMEAKCQERRGEWLHLNTSSWEWVWISAASSRAQGCLSRTKRSGKGNFNGTCALGESFPCVFPSAFSWSAIKSAANTAAQGSQPKDHIQPCLQGWEEEREMGIGCCCKAEWKLKAHLKASRFNQHLQNVWEYNNQRSQPNIQLFWSLPLIDWFIIHISHSKAKIPQTQISEVVPSKPLYSCRGWHL